MAQAVADVYATNIQVIDPTLPELFEKNPTTYGLLRFLSLGHRRFAGDVGVTTVGNGTCPLPLAFD